MRGLLWAVGPSLIVWGAAAVLVALLVTGCAGPGHGGSPGPRTPSSAPAAPASTAPATPDPIDEALGRAWDSDPHRYACGMPSTDVTDALAAVVLTVVEVDHLTAVLIAQQYRARQCPGR